MCGITGFWLRQQTEPHPIELLEQMAPTLAHRAPDDSGTFYDTSTGTALGFRRLSIIDVSPQGHQPIKSASARFVIVFDVDGCHIEEIAAQLRPHQRPRHSYTEL